MTALYLLSLLLFLAYVSKLASHIARRSLTEWLLTTFLLLTSSVILTGFILSALYLTGRPLAWALAVFVTATVLGRSLRWLTPARERYGIRRLVADRWRLLGRWFGALTTYQKALFGLLFTTLAVIAVTNGLLVLFTVPNEWDSMTGHLNRVMQYVQRGSMRHFGGTNWNIDTYPKSVCTLQIYPFLMTGRTEVAFRFIHHLSYWTAIVAVFGIVQRISAIALASRPNVATSATTSGQLATTFSHLSAGFFCALVYALLPDFLMQAITTETDIVLTAYLSVLLYMLFSYYASGLTPPRDNRYLWGAGMAFGLAFGHKITFALLLPSVFVVMLYTVFWPDTWSATSLSTTFRRTGRLAAAIAVSMCLWTLPTGYLKNVAVFGHPIGPPTALKHQSVERAGSLRNLLEQGTRNVLRYGIDHVNLDGIRNLPAGAALNTQMRRPLMWLENRLKLRLDEETDFSIIPFSFERRFWFYNANPYWGVFGFGLILPLTALALLNVVGPRRWRSVPHTVLAVALGLHFLALSYSAPYDPFKGRYFIETGLFGVTMLAMLFTLPPLRINAPGKPLWKGYVGLVTVLGCVSAVLCVFLNVRALPLGWGERPSVFRMSRMQQFMVGRPDILTPYARFDSLVPPNATVALGTINDDYEYPLYGEQLARRLITINPFEQGVQPIPPEAEYLFFAKKVIKPQPGDIRLGTDTTLTDLITPGEDYYLRKLKR